MSAHEQAAPGRTSIAKSEAGDWLRLVGGMLFASGAIALAVRKGEEWSPWAILATLAVPCVALYVLAVIGGHARVADEYGHDGGTRPRPHGWQSAFYVFALLLLPLVLVQFVDAIEGDTSSPLNIAWIFAVSAVVALVTTIRAGAWWPMLLAGAYAVVAWLAFWSDVLEDPSPDTFRWLLILLAAVLLLAALVLRRTGRAESSDLITIAGIAALLAGSISLAGLSSGSDVVDAVGGDEVPRPTQGWNVYTLVVSLALIGYGSRVRTRGPSYVGGAGLLLFIGLVGSNVVARLKGDDASAVVGWPLILLILGVALLVAGFFLPPGRSGRGVDLGPDGGSGAPAGAVASPGATRVHAQPGGAQPGGQQPGYGQPGYGQPGPGQPGGPGAPPPPPPRQ